MTILVDLHWLMDSPGRAASPALRPCCKPVFGYFAVLSIMSLDGR